MLDFTNFFVVNAMWKDPKTCGISIRTAYQLVESNVNTKNRSS